MDYKKDTTSQDVHHKGQNPSLLDNSHMNQDAFLTPLYTRTQKLITALYMVTDCLEDGEPIKFRLRTLGVGLISDILTLRADRAISKTFRFENIKSHLDELTALIEIVGTVGLVSGMNSTILAKEFLGLKLAINEWEELNKKSNFQDPIFGSDGISNTTLSESYFETPLRPLGTSSYEREETMHKGHVLYKKEAIVKGHLGKLGAGPDTNDKKNSKTDIALKINRRNNILSLIKDRKEVTIKDISHVVSDCSEKTIQRELISLVSLGVLKKKGNKRWSRYSIA